MKRIQVEAKKYIFRKGDAANGVYLVISGQVGIFLPSNSGEKPNFIVRENELFGEMGVVSEQSRMANAQATTECDLLFVSREEFDQMVEGSSCCGEGCFADSCRSIAERTGGKKIANLDPSNRKMI